MTNNLMIFLVLLCVGTFALLVRMVKRKKIVFKHAIWWGLLDVVLLILVFSTASLRRIADLIGIETVSNMVYLFGFIVLIAICMALTTIASEQKTKIINLTQELAILDNKVKEMEHATANKENFEG